MSTPPYIDLPPGVVAERWQVRGAERAVMHAGLADAQSWVVLVPGFTGSKEDFIAVLPLLDEAGIGALTYDHLGQYQSDASNDPDDYALTALAADLAALVDTASLRFDLSTPPHVVGHSFGGLVTQQAVIDAALRPRTLVLLCTGPGEMSGDRRQQLTDLVAALEHHDLATIWRIMHDLDEEPADVSPEVAAFLEERWHANSPTHMSACATILLTQPDLTADLAPAVADLPTTVMWGEHDDAWPIAAQRALAADIGAGTHELPGLGHSPNAEDPRALVSALVDAFGG